MQGFIREIFTSIQGEGIKVGQRQTFIRFLGCNLSCKYCDTPETQKMEGPFIFEDKIFKNPIEIESLIDELREPEVAITGGEPLLQIDALKVICKNLKKINKSIYLDTNGTLPEALEQIIQYVDTVALDFKIPSATGMKGFWQEHESCLSIASGKEVFIKMVIDENILDDELVKTCNIIEKHNRSIPLIIQPVFDVKIPNILDLQKKALGRLENVRVIPQVHKYLGLK
jgi:7-carboxy-7-deazaguanine synthase